MTKLTTLLILLAPLALTAAVPAAPESSDLSISLPSMSLSDADNLLSGSDNGTHILQARYVPYCKCTKDGKCKMRKEFPCKQSNCIGREGEKCPLGRNEKGDFVAKCPNNEAGYEWDWPWKGE